MTDDGTQPQRTLEEMVALTRQVQQQFADLPVLPYAQIEEMIAANPLAYAYPVDPLGLATGRRYQRDETPSLLLAGDLTVPGSPLHVMYTKVVAFGDQAERQGFADLDAYRALLVEGWTEIGLPPDQQRRLLAVFDAELEITDAAGQVEWRERPTAPGS